MNGANLKTWPATTRSCRSATAEAKCAELSRVGVAFQTKAAGVGQLFDKAELRCQMLDAGTKGALTSNIWHLISGLRYVM